MTVPTTNSEGLSKRMNKLQYIVDNIVDNSIVVGTDSRQFEVGAESGFHSYWTGRRQQDIYDPLARVSQTFSATCARGPILVQHAVKLVQHAVRAPSCTTYGYYKGRGEPVVQPTTEVMRSSVVGFF